MRAVSSNISIRQDQIETVLVAQPSTDARDRAYTMLLIAEVGLHSFDHDAGRRLHSQMEEAEMEDDAKRTVILKLHPNTDVGKLLLQRCGIRPRWLTGYQARDLSRRLREEEFPPAVTRNVLEHLGHDPDTYYNIGADYRIPEPSEEEKAYCVQGLQQAGFSDETIENALATLGVPIGGHHPPKRSSKKQA